MMLKNYSFQVLSNWFWVFNRITVYLLQKNIIMKKIIKLSESDLTRIVKRVIKESRSEKIEKPKGFAAYNQHCKNKSRGGFDIRLNKVRFSCLTSDNENHTFISSSVNPFTSSTRGNYSVDGNSITLTTTL